LFVKLEIQLMIKQYKIAVFASGTGTNFINIYKNFKLAKISLLISNNPNSGAVEFARKNKIDFKIINEFRYSENINDVYLNVLKEYRIDLILLAGFMKKIPNNLIKNYKNKIINVHPSLLPKYGGKGFYGMNVHQQVFKNKDKKTGATIHFVNSEYDKGPIILQKELDIVDNESVESISKRVLDIEYKLYLKVLNLYFNNKIRIINNKVMVNEDN
tara:strand:- start:2255 stop:2899 length:645 start_codon:yes stop_codon:yes gene_type:complete